MADRKQKKKKKGVKQEVKNCESLEMTHSMCVYIRIGKMCGLGVVTVEGGRRVVNKV